MNGFRAKQWDKAWYMVYRYEQRINPTIIGFLKDEEKSYSRPVFIPEREIEEWKEKYGDRLEVLE